MNMYQTLRELDNMRKRGFGNMRDSAENPEAFAEMASDRMSQGMGYRGAGDRGQRVGPAAMASTSGGNLGFVPTDSQMSDPGNWLPGGGMFAGHTKRVFKGLPSLLSLREATKEADTAIAAAKSGGPAIISRKPEPLRLLPKTDSPYIDTEQFLPARQEPLMSFGGGGAGLRNSITGATPAQKAQASALLEDRGILATPNELGLTTQGFDPMPSGKLIEETTRAFKESGIPRAESTLGEGVSGFRELPWGAEGAGTATQESLRSLLALPPTDVARLDRTGQFQEAGRLLNAADRGFADRFAIPARQDLLTLREIVQKDGLAGLLNRVKTQGYAGLPAAGAMGIGLDQEEERKRPWW